MRLIYEDNHQARALSYRDSLVLDRNAGYFYDCSGQWVRFKAFGSSDGVGDGRAFTSLNADFDNSSRTLSLEYRDDAGSVKTTQLEIPDKSISGASWDDSTNSLYLQLNNGSELSVKITDEIAEYLGGVRHVLPGSQSVEITNTDSNGISVDLSSTVKQSLSLANNSVQKNDIYYNVKDFGALGDGASNDTASIQSALDYCSNQGGGTVFIPSGVYIIDGSSIKPQSNTKLLGSGKSSILKMSSDSYASNFIYVISIVGVENVSISDLSIDGNKPIEDESEMQAHGVSIDGDSSNITLQYLSISNFKGDGVWVALNPGRSVPADNISILNCDINLNNRQAVAIVQATRVNISGVSSDGSIDIESDSTGYINYNHIVQGCIVDDISVSPLSASSKDSSISVVNNISNTMFIWGANNAVFSGNIIKDSLTIAHAGDIVISDNTIGEVRSLVANGETIKRLKFDNNIIECSKTSGYAVELKSCNELFMSNCRIDAPNCGGVHQSNNTYATSYGNGTYIDKTVINSKLDSININSNGEAYREFTVTDSSLESEDGYSILKDASTSNGSFKAERVVFKSKLGIKRNLGSFDIIDCLIDSAAPAYNLCSYSPGTKMNIDGLKITGGAKTIYITDTEFNSIQIRGVINGSAPYDAPKFDWSRSSNTGDAIIDNVRASSTNWMGQIPGLILAGSNYYTVGTPTPSRFVYDGSSWNNTI